MGNAVPRPIRRAVYVSCLDASFARTGACVGIVDRPDSVTWHDLVDKKDRILRGTSKKAQAIARTVQTKSFEELDRRIRQEILAIDGATVLSHTGEILAVGAILKIPAGSAGGGRLAAAKALAEFGIGIKVSQDGSITGFRSGHDEPAFRLM